MSVAVALAAAGANAAFAATTNPNPGALEQQHSDLSERAATEGMVLLQNRDHALPLAKGGNVALFGVGSYATVKGGTGSGAVNNRSNVNVRTGLESAGYTVTTGSAYWSAMTAATDYAIAHPTGPFGGSPNYAGAEQALTAETAAPTASTDTAIYVIPRNSGEGADRSSGAGDYLLGANEQANIALLGTLYTKVIVVLNTGGIMDTSFFDTINGSEADPQGGTALDSLLLMSQAGQRGGDALAQILDGEVTPSGKLTDTWASKYAYYPASATFAAADGNSTQEYYSEGVYVGYRYFDSFYGSLDADDPASVVDYPFGFGLSYTDFQVDPLSVTADMSSVTVKARVTNVGDTYSGKEVVETYFSAPQTGLDKPYQQLSGYAKTDSLAPGASQTVTIRYNTTDMASYDEAKAAYVMDAGDYVIRVGDSSRNTHVAATVHLAQTTTTEQLANEETDQSLDTLTSDPADFYGYPGESDEIAAAPVLTLDTTGFTAPNHASENEQDVAVDPTSTYGLLDGSSISSTVASVPTGQTNWEGTGAPYVAKTGETVRSVDVDPTKTLFDVAKGDYSLEQFVAGLSVTQLGNLVEGASAAGSTLTAVGAAGYTTAKYESLGIPGMTLSDGPAGLRLTQKIATTPATYQWETAWPIGTMLAQTWNRELIQQVGDAIGKEMLDVGVTLWLAPGMNIHRDPLNGRNFEYYSEDPLVTGLTAAATTEGVQSNPGVGVTIKHYATNNQETSRSGENNTVDERALREIYLRGFEIAVKTAQPMAIMTSYNRINGTYASANYDMLQDLLRGEWGFHGLVMTDWGGAHGAVPTMYAGNDLIMPGNNAAEVINSTVTQAPTIDSSGLPSYNKLTTLSNNRTTYSWAFNSLTPSATGTQTITTTVDAAKATATPLSGSTVRDTINNETFTPNSAYASVQAAYNDAKALVTTTTGTPVPFTAAQRAAITIGGEQYETPGDSSTPLVSYTVTIKGNYATVPTMRLGDLQRSARDILNVIAQSAPFQQLAGIKGVAGISVKPYTAQFTDREHAVDSSVGKIVPSQAGDKPTVAIATSPSEPASGWFTGPVTVALSTDGDNAEYIDVDSGELQNYTAPVTIEADGTHTVRALAVNADGVFSDIAETTVKVDATAPELTATGTDGVLKASATDATSGLDTIEYSLDGGDTWTTYTAQVAVPSLPRDVLVRATDVAGNVATQTVSVAGVAPHVTLQPVSKAVRAGTAVTLHATASGTPTPTVQWQVSTNGTTWSSVSGATSTAYKITSVLAGAHRYRAVFTNSSGTATSSAATITGKVASSVAISLKASTITHGQLAYVNVVVSPTTAPPTGTVTIKYGSLTKVLTMTAANKGRFTASLPGITKAGTYTVTVVYAGSTTLLGDTSNSVTLHVK